MAPPSTVKVFVPLIACANNKIQMSPKKFSLALFLLLLNSCALIAQSSPIPSSEGVSSLISSNEDTTDVLIAPVITDTFMPLVTVGDAGNEADSITGYGAVENSFSMGRFEVTADQYCAFLNAVATDADPYQLYDSNMGSDEAVKCIKRSEGEPLYTYTIIQDGKNRGQFPITYITLYSAARFCNWMEQGRPSSDPEHRVTEVGAYNLNGAMRGPLARVSEATWFIPNEEELYKSIYYKGEGVHADYYSYPNRSLSYPGHTIGKTNNEANCRDSYSYGPRNKPPYLTPVGIFSTSVSAYDALDTGGNVDQWTTQGDSSQGSTLFYVIRGGSWQTSCSYTQSNDLQKEVRRSVSSTTKSNTLGFRIASSLVAAGNSIPTTRPPAESQWTTGEKAGIFGLAILGGYGVKKGSDHYYSKNQESIEGNRVLQTPPRENRDRSTGGNQGVSGAAQTPDWDQYKTPHEKPPQQQEVFLTPAQTKDTLPRQAGSSMTQSYIKIKTPKEEFVVVSANNPKGDASHKGEVTPHQAAEEANATSKLTLWQWIFGGEQSSANK